MALAGDDTVSRFLAALAASRADPRTGLPSLDAGWALYRLVSGARPTHRVTIEKRSLARRYVCSVTGAELDTDSPRGRPSAHACQAVTEWIGSGGDAWRPVRLEPFDFAASRLLGLVDEQALAADPAALGVALDRALADVQV